MKSTKAVRSEVAKVQCKIDIAKERTVEAERVESKGQVILTEVGTETKFLKEALKAIKKKLASGEKGVWVAE